MRQPRTFRNGERTIKQKVWDYIRRNKLFTPRDIQVILRVDYQTLRGFLYPLEVAGLLVARNKKIFMNKVYALNVKENEIYAPLVNKNEVYCYKSKSSCDVGARVLLKKALKSMSQQALADELGVSKATVNRVLHNNYPSPAPIYQKIRETLRDV